MKHSSLIGRAASLPAPPPPPPPGPRFLDPKTVTSRERRARILKLTAGAAPGFDLREDDIDGVSRALAAQAEERGRPDLAARWRVVASKRESALASPKLSPAKEAP